MAPKHTRRVPPDSAMIYECHAVSKFRPVVVVIVPSRRRYSNSIYYPVTSSTQKHRASAFSRATP